MIFSFFIRKDNKDVQGEEISPEPSVYSEIIIEPEITEQPTPTLELTPEPTVSYLDFSEKSELLYSGFISEEDLDTILSEYGIAYETYLSYKQYNRDDIVKIAKTIYGECGSTYLSLHEKASVAWTILNHVDSSIIKYNTIDSVINKNSFHGYSASHPTVDWCLEMAEDICIRWTLEKIGLEYVGRTLPKEYIYFSSYIGSDGLSHSRSRISYKDNNYYDWSLPLPY